MSNTNEVKRLAQKLKGYVQGRGMKGLEWIHLSGGLMQSQ
jgi:hypothetical protein